MTNEQNEILRRLSAALFGSAEQPSALAPAVARESHSHAILPLICPADHPEPLGSFVMKQLAANVQVEYAHAELHQLLTAHHIPYVILKGCAAAAYYPQPGLRPLGDVDFFTADVEKAGEVLEAAGFRASEDHEHTYHQVYEREQISLELHWGIPGIPHGRDDVTALFDDLIERSECLHTDYGDMLIPSAFHHGLILLFHMASHMINTGIGLRHLCDWAVFVEHFDDSTFCAMYEEKLRAIGMWRFTQIITQLCTRYLHLRQCAWASADDEVLEGLIEDILSSGNFGQKDPQRINQAKLMTNDNKQSVDDTGMIRQLFSMLTVKAESVMPVCRRIRVLLPIGWGYVSIRHLLRIATGKRPAIHMKAMVSGAEKRSKVYRELKLFDAES